MLTFKVHTCSLLPHVAVPRNNAHLLDSLAHFTCSHVHMDYALHVDVKFERVTHHIACLSRLRDDPSTHIFSEAKH